MFMPNYSKNEIVLIAFPFSDLSSFKVRPAVIVNAPHISQDVFIVPMTSKTNNLLKGEFVLKEWKTAGLNVETVVKRGIFTIKENLIKKKVGSLLKVDSDEIEKSLKLWLVF
jgi:mRNA interferase MazF